MTDIEYHPVVGDLDEMLEGDPADRLLLVDVPVPSRLRHDGLDVRRLQNPAVALPTGIYRFDDDGWSVMAVGAGGAPGTPAAASWDAEDDDPLINAFGWLATWWDQADEVPAPRFEPSDEVVTVPEGQEGRVRTRRFADSGWTYVVRVGGRTVSRAEGGLRQLELDDDPYAWVARAPGNANRFAATLTRAKLAQQLTDTVFSFRATRTIFRPYQFRPILRLLETGQLRLLIADEVGLGKTIEAGLVWTELDARQQADRVLVVCPSMLVPKWQAEMEERFGYTLNTLDKKGLADLLDRVETDRLPSRYHVVASIERLRTWEGLDRLAELAPRFDLVIADEAHAFRNVTTRTHALGIHLAEWADALVLLSATPLNLGNDDLFNLLQLLAPGDFDDRVLLEDQLAPNAVLHRVAASLLDRSVSNERRRRWLAELDDLTFGPAVTSRPELAELHVLFSEGTLEPSRVPEARRLIARLHALSAVVTRTRKVEVEDRKAVREAISIEVHPTEVEWELYVQFDKWQRERARRRGLPVGFVTQMPLRLASTCLPAARARVLDTASAWDADLDSSGRTDEERNIDDDDRPPPEVVEAALAVPVGLDTKFDRFLEQLLPIVHQGKQVLVFTFSRRALAYLQERLREHVTTTVLHGGVKKEERQEVMRRFRDGDFEVMIASRVASEGLDFEFCSAVVNYDLPWNPMEVEQRIGRIDRFGQEEEKVFILNFHTPGTIETDIIERVHNRIGVFTDSIGELEPILQSRMAELTRTMFDFSLDEAQRERRIDEIVAAIEEKRLTRDEVESASAYLSSADGAAIDGLEQDLTSTGRFVGQPELALLLDDWAQTADGAATTTSADGTRLTFTGTASLAEDLAAVEAAGERSRAEIDDLLRKLRSERDIVMSLDQEDARLTGASLLSSNHPLVRAALRIPGHEQIRFASLALTSDELDPGIYLALMTIARWAGARPSTELWTSAVPIDGRRGRPNQAVGNAVLGGLALGLLKSGPTPAVDVDLEGALAQLAEDLDARQSLEQDRRLAANEALIEARRISLQESHARKLGQIRRRIDTLRRNDKGTNVIRLHEAQRANQDRRLENALRDLDAKRTGSMEVEYLAVAQVAVSRSK